MNSHYNGSKPFNSASWFTARCRCRFCRDYHLILILVHKNSSSLSANDFGLRVCIPTIGYWSNMSDLHGDSCSQSRRVAITLHTRYIKAVHQTPFTTAPITLRQADRRFKRLAYPCCFVAPLYLLYNNYIIFLCKNQKI